MFACFICIDVDNSLNIQIDEWQSFMKQVFNDRVYLEKLQAIFYILDIDSNNSVNLDQFFNSIKLIKQTEELFRPWDKELEIWRKFKGCLRKCLKLDKLAKSSILEGFMLLIVLFNTIMLLYE